MVITPGSLAREGLGRWELLGWGCQGGPLRVGIWAEA